MTTETEAPEGATPPAESGNVIVRPDVVDAYMAMAAGIPEAGGDGAESILLQILQTNDPDALDAPWRADGLREYLDQPIRIDGLRRMGSEFAGGLPFFLIVDAADVSTGERITVTTGAVSVVAQLAKAFSLGLIPGWRVIPRQSARPSAAGYYPQHLEVMKGRLARES